MIYTPEEFKNHMTVLEEIYDTEDRHIAMDNLMCEVLIGLGFHEGVETFYNTHKWYA